MSNQNGEQIRVEENNGDDNVSCVTSISRTTHETDTLSSSERELLQLPDKIYAAINNGDMDQFRQLLTKYFTENCMFQAPTMETPEYGIHHILSTVEGVIQNLPDFIISASNIRWINREVISGNIVSPRIIVFERNFVGKFFFQHYKIPFDFPDHHPLSLSWYTHFPCSYQRISYG